MFQQKQGSLQSPHVAQIKQSLLRASNLQSYPFATEGHPLALAFSTVSCKPPITLPAPFRASHQLAHVSAACLLTYSQQLSLRTHGMQTRNIGGQERYTLGGDVSRNLGAKTCTRSSHFGHRSLAKRFRLLCRILRPARLCDQPLDRATALGHHWGRGGECR